MPEMPSRSRVSPAADTVHYISLPVGFVTAMLLVRRLWFHEDDWDFLVNYDLARHPMDLFLPHNEHLSVLPILVYKALFGTFAARDYLPYGAVVVGLHVLTAHLLWRLARRHGVDPGLATTLTVIFLFLGAGYFNIVTAFQMSFVASTAFGVGALLVVDSTDEPGRRRLAATAALCLGSILSSGLGPAFTLIVVSFALLRYGPRQAARLVALPAGFYLLWLGMVGRHHLPALGQTDKLQYLLLPDFAWVGLTSSLEGATGLTGMGAVLVVVLAVVTVRRGDWHSRTSAIVASLALGALVLFLVVGSGRLLFGTAYASQSRYVYEGTAVLFLPAAVALSSLPARASAARVALLVLLSLMAVRGAYQLNSAGGGLAAAGAGERARILAAAGIISSGAPILASDRTIVQLDFLDVGGLRRLQARRALPDSAPGADDPNSLAARALLETTVTRGTLSPASSESIIVGAAGITVGDSKAGCFEVDSIGANSWLLLSSTGSTTLGITSDQGGSLGVFLESAAHPAARSSPIRHQLSPDDPVTVEADAEGTNLGLVLPFGRSAVCGADLRRG